GRHALRDRRDRLRGVRLRTGLGILPRGETTPDGRGRQTDRSRRRDERLTRETTMSSSPKTAIVTGASQGIGAGIVKAFVQRVLTAVATAGKMTDSQEGAASSQIALVDGDIGEPATASRIVDTALSRFTSIDAVVNNAGIFFTRPFTEYT